MLFHQRFVPGLAIASYIVGDEKSGEAAVIDPTRDVDDFIAFAKDNDLHIRHIIETHVHADFVCGSRELKARLNDEPTIHCSGYGGEDWTQPYADRARQRRRHDRDGRCPTSAFQHTPGHTPEHISITLFDTSRSRRRRGSCSAAIFCSLAMWVVPICLGEEAKKELAHQLYQSVFERIDGSARHHRGLSRPRSRFTCGKAIGSRRSSTVGFERRFNPLAARKTGRTVGAGSTR